MSPPLSSGSPRSGSSSASRIAGATRLSYTASKSTEPLRPSGLTPNGMITKQSGSPVTAQAYAASEPARSLDEQHPSPPEVAGRRGSRRELWPGGGSRRSTGLADPTDRLVERLKGGCCEQRQP